MRHKFLLDVNILHHAVRGVDEHDRPDGTAADLIGAIVRICHTLTIHESLLRKYWSDLQELFTVRSPHLEPLFFVNQIIRRPDKRILEYEPLPELPPGVTIPAEDVEVVRAALISRPIIVSADGELREAIKGCPVLGLTAYTPKEALEFAKRNPAG